MNKEVSLCAVKTYLPIAKMKLHPRNPRRIDPERLADLKNSIVKKGFYQPILIWKKGGIILSGNHRYKAVNELIAEGYTFTSPDGKPGVLPVVIEDVSDEMAEAILFESNNNYAEWIEDKLAHALKEAAEAGYALNDFGFDTEYMETILRKAKLDTESILSGISNYEADGDTDEDDVPEMAQDKRVNLGDIFQLGDHTLMCGDATNLANVLTLMDGQLADLVITDPPYNVAVNDESEESLKARNRRSDGLKIKNDKMSEFDFDKFLKDTFVNYHKVMRDGAAIYVFYADSMTIPFLTTFMDADFHFAQNCIWNKQQFVMTRKDYHYKHEPIIYGWKLGEAHAWEADRTQSSVWSFDRPFKNELHPTMKPINLIEYPMRNSSRREDLVLDLFGGSGSTMIAAEKTRRKCRMMELDPHYCSVILERWAKFTNKMPVRADGKLWKDITPGDTMTAKPAAKKKKK